MIISISQFCPTLPCLPIHHHNSRYCLFILYLFIICVQKSCIYERKSNNFVRFSFAPVRKAFTRCPQNGTSLLLSSKIVSEFRTSADFGVTSRFIVLVMKPLAKWRKPCFSNRLMISFIVEGLTCSTLARRLFEPCQPCLPNSSEWVRPCIYA